MVLTPQMRQSFELLTMPSKELSEYIDSILEKNPFLKKEYDKKGQASHSFDTTDQVKTIAREDPREAILSQMRMRDLDDKGLKIAEYLIYEMDANGYITGDLDDAALELSATSDDVEKVLAIIQDMEPAGLGARDARECLQLQLRRMGKEPSVEYTIVTDFLQELAANDVDKIRDALDIDEAKVLAAIESIKKLNPRPAVNTLSERSQAIIPDMVARVKNKTISIGINHAYLPELKFYNPYKNEADIIKEPEAREFIKNNETAAKHLIDNLKRREDTMCRVANYILTFQKASLNRKDHLKSLTINDIAKALGLHPSTISRTVANKYLQLGGETIPLASLLSTGIRKTDGAMISKTAIKNKITGLVGAEAKERPLGDGDIKDALAKEGIVIERRTVAKYRNALRILPKHLRRKVRSA